MPERVFQAIGRPELNRDWRFASNAEWVKRKDEVDAMISEWVGQGNAGDLRLLDEILVDAHSRAITARVT